MSSDRWHCWPLPESSGGRRELAAQVLRAFLSLAVALRCSGSPDGELQPGRGASSWQLPGIRLGAADSEQSGNRQLGDASCGCCQPGLAQLPHPRAASGVWGRATGTDGSCRRHWDREGVQGVRELHRATTPPQGSDRLLTPLPLCVCVQMSLSSARSLLSGCPGAAEPQQQLQAPVRVRGPPGEPGHGRAPGQGLLPLPRPGAHPAGTAPRGRGGSVCRAPGCSEPAFAPPLLGTPPAGQFPQPWWCSLILPSPFP